MGGGAGPNLTAVLAAALAAVGPAARAAPRATAAPGAATRALVLVLGDSLSAEYGLRRGSGWVELMAQRLAGASPRWQTFNASISGETTAGGRTRLAGLLTEHRPRVVIIELGGNDALRGLDLATTQAALDTMVASAQASGAKVLLLGMRMPPNYGRAYGERFERLYREVAGARRCALVPFFLEGVGERIELFQADRIHPTEQAQPMMLANVWPALQPLLK
ncbi:MAG: arylesterase [Burkholderiaceae bacterium]|nr:arylesterase [Burkholderiaceae bacterium]